MKIILVTSFIALALAGVVATPAQARPLVEKCSIWAVKRAPADGPQLVADIPKSMTPVNLDTVRFLDKKLAHKVVVQSVNAGRTETDTVKVAARLFNCTNQPQTVLLRTHFVDGDGASSEPVTMWQTLFLEPRSMTVYSERSIGTTVVRHFSIELTEAR